MIVSSWARAFPGTAEHARAARRFVASLLEGSLFAEDAALIVSELFANAILHSESGKPGGLVTVQVSRWLLGVRIAVTDQGSVRHPVIRDGEPFRELAESGSGLYMVRQLAAELDWHDDASGRTVHATLGARPPGQRGLPGHQGSERLRLPQSA